MAWWLGGCKYLVIGLTVFAVQTMPAAVAALAVLTVFAVPTTLTSLSVVAVLAI